MRIDRNAIVALFDAAVDDLEQDLQDAVRPAAQAAAQVFYNEVVLNVARLGKVTGNLASSIYQAYSKDNSPAGVATYHISWNARKAPHGHLVEYGYLQRYRVVLNKKTGKWVTLKDQPLSQPIQVAAHPFIRPAFDKEAAAVNAAEVVIFSRINKETAL